MNIKYSIKTSLTGLKTNKSRSFLTILGIVIGITAIILVMSLGRGAQNLILGQIQSMGSKTIAIAPGRQPSGMTDSLNTFTDSLKNKDVEDLQKKSNVPHLAKIMPIVFGSESATRENKIHQTTIFGVNNFFTQIYDIYPEEGRIFTDEEIASKSAVVIIGSKIKEKLFETDEQVLGQKIKVKNQNLRIIGVLPKKGQFSFISFDDALIVPYSTAQQYIFGIKYYNRLVVEVDEEKNVDRTIEDIKITLRNNHNITDPDKDDFFLETQAQVMEMVGTVMNTLTLFLTAMAAISLVVGGVGIMNIMLVSVTERTHEIGLRKALGATNQDILSQFLIESMMLTIIGGIIGILLGAGFSFLISLILSKIMALNWTFAFPVSGALLGLGVSAFVGLVFGIYPARRASLKNPIEALRYE
ncbi:MAG: ABC transporter permease [Patescibacteria group bacterium]|nr:ABC transporter permease [Patescibacteria group bacterium]MDD5164432.1 ABC transporter permease [Patescibacteria group bacterium]MDD5534591.1 ABC transporter permease [Patescibacteria group bacterium]